MSEFVEITGTFMWTRSAKPELDPWGNENYSTAIRPDAGSLETVMDLQAQGIRNTLKKDDEGYYVSFKRPHSRKMRGEDVVLGPPAIYEADGITPLKDLIGNGSKGTIKLEIYSYKAPGTDKQSKAARWHSATITDLVPYFSSGSNGF